MKSTAGKIVFIIGGYMVAVGAALVLAYVRVQMTSGPDRDASAGMYAFGDLLWFLFLLGILTLPVTALALYFLRAERWFWKLFSGAALAVASTAALASILFFAGRGQSGGLLGNLAGVSVLRILAEPLFATVFVVGAVPAPERPFARALLAAGVIEAVSFVPVLLYWIAGFSR
jgi:hypothetical protein